MAWKNNDWSVAVYGLQIPSRVLEFRVMKFVQGVTAPDDTFANSPKLVEIDISSSLPTAN